MENFEKSLYSHYEESNTLTWKEINAQHHVGHAQTLALINV